MEAMRDPVCGRFVTEETAQAVAEYRGRRYLFCSRGCRAAFERNPETCLVTSGVEKTSTPEGLQRWECRRQDTP